MSLSQFKEKVKWSLNPRGAAWANDDSKFGQRMLEKMGWSKGKGLGKNEDGNPDHIKVAKKSDSSGMGFKGYNDVWIEHQKDFGEILKSLNGNAELNDANDTNNLKSLEERSSKSKKRVQYNKFIRSKDLSSRSSKDLHCIFGTLDSNQESEQFKESSNVINSGNMEEYFKKMKKMKNERTNSKSNSVEENSPDRKRKKDARDYSENFETSEPAMASDQATTNYNYDYLENENGISTSHDVETVRKSKRHKRRAAELDSYNTAPDECHDFGKKKKTSTPCFATGDCSEECNDNVKRKKSKSRKNTIALNGENDTNAITNHDESSYNDAIDVSGKILKKNKEHKSRRSKVNGGNDYELDETRDGKMKTKHSVVEKLEGLDMDESNVHESDPMSSSKFKKMRKNNKENDEDFVDETNKNFSSEERSDYNSERIESLKIKKSKKTNDACRTSENSIDQNSEIHANCQTGLEEIKSDKSKKKRKRDDAEITESDNICKKSKKDKTNNDEINVDEAVKIKKKKKNRDGCQITEIVTELNDEITADNESEIKEKVKIKKKKHEVVRESEDDSTAINGNANEHRELEDNYSKKKKKKKLTWEESVEIDNALNMHQESNADKSSKTRSKKDELQMVPEGTTSVDVDVNENLEREIDINCNFVPKNGNHHFQSNYMKRKTQSQIMRLQRAIKYRYLRSSKPTQHEFRPKKKEPTDAEKIHKQRIKDPKQRQKIIDNLRRLNVFPNSNFHTFTNGYPR